MNIGATGLMATVAQASLPAAAPVAQVADPLATARFSEVMNAQPTPVAEAVEAAYPQAIPGERKTLGDTILSGMQGLSSEFQQSWKTVNSVLEGGSAMTTYDMLKLQMGLTQMSIQYDLVGKAISRSTQNLDQLVKMQ